MSIDESLARGLKERFFLEHKESTRQLIDGAQAIWHPPASSQFDKAVKIMTMRFLDWSNQHYVGGGKKNRYLAIELFAPHHQHIHNEWSEKVAIGVTLFFQSGADTIGVDETGYTIGEHAIARLYQRTLTRISNFDLATRFVTRQTTWLGMWGNIWRLAIQNMPCNLPKDCLNLFAPTPTGLFLGRFNTTGYIVDFRTFIADNDLHAEQAFVKVNLERISKELTPSPIYFGRICITLDYAINSVDSMLAAELIYTSTSYEAFLNLAVREIESDVHRRDARNHLNSHFKKWALEFPSSFKDMIRIRGKEALNVLVRQKLPPRHLQTHS